MGHEGHSRQQDDIDNGQNLDRGAQIHAVHFPAADPQQDQRGAQNGQRPGTLPVIEAPQDPQQHHHGDDHAQKRNGGSHIGSDQVVGHSQEHTGSQNAPANSTPLGQLMPHSRENGAKNGHSDAHIQKIVEVAVPGNHLLQRSVDIEPADYQQIELCHAAAQKKLHCAGHRLVPLDGLGLAVWILAHL